MDPRARILFLFSLLHFRSIADLLLTSNVYTYCHDSTCKLDFFLCSNRTCSAPNNAEYNYCLNIDDNVDVYWKVIYGVGSLSWFVESCRFSLVSRQSTYGKEFVLCLSIRRGTKAILWSFLISNSLRQTLQKFHVKSFVWVCNRKLLLAKGRRANP